MPQLSLKPVRNCHSCLLNMGDHCWLYRYPRGQWRSDHRCRAFDNETVYDGFRLWQKQPDVKSRRELRRLVHRQRKRSVGGEGREWWERQQQS
jgi:hypothetical protein